MQQKDLKNTAQKWFVLVVAGALFTFSTVWRCISGQGADTTLGTIFIVLSGLVFGAKIAEYFKK